MKDTAQLNQHNTFYTVDGVHLGAVTDSVLFKASDGNYGTQAFPSDL